MPWSVVFDMSSGFLPMLASYCVIFPLECRGSRSTIEMHAEVDGPICRHSQAHATGSGGLIKMREKESMSDT